MKEVWRDIPNYEGSYQASNLGRIKSLKFNKERILKTPINGVGYSAVLLCVNCKPKNFTVHQLVAMAFFGHAPNGYKLVCNHKNFIKTDNRIENLELTTQRKNSNRKHFKSSSKYTGVSRNKGSKKWRAQIYLKGKVSHLGCFDSELEASKVYQDKLLQTTI